MSDNSDSDLEIFGDAIDNGDNTAEKSRKEQVSKMKFLIFVILIFAGYIV